MHIISLEGTEYIKSWCQEHMCGICFQKLSFLVNKMLKRRLKQNAILGGGM